MLKIKRLRSILVPNWGTWAKGETGLRAAILLGISSDRRTVPVLIEYCLDNDYCINEDIREGERHFNRYMLFTPAEYIVSRMLYSLTDGRTGMKNPPIPARDLPPKREDIDKMKSEIRDWWAKNKEEFLKELEKEYGSIEIGENEKSPKEKNSGKDQGNSPKEPKPGTKKPSSLATDNNGNSSNSTPGAEKKLQSAEKAKPDTESLKVDKRQYENLLLISTAIFIVLMGILIFLLLRRKNAAK